MPLVTSYRRYEAKAVLGGICSPLGNVVNLHGDKVAVPLLGGVAVYHTRTAERLALVGLDSQVRGVDG